MKKIFLLLILGFAVFFIACKSGGSGPAYTIKMRLNKGDTFTHDIKVNMVTKSSGMDMNMNVETECGFTVINATSEEKELKMTYTKMQTQLVMGNANAMRTVPDSIINKTNKSAVGKSVIIKLSKDNHIVDVAGVENLMNRDSMSEASKQMLQKMFTKEQFNNLFGMMFSMYPKTPVRVGDSWNSETTVNMVGIDIGVKITYTLNSVKNGLANIGVDGVIDGKGVLNKNKVNLEMKMSGDQKGTLSIKLADGYLQSGFYKMNLNASMEMIGRNMPMVMKADYTLTGK